MSEAVARLLELDPSLIVRALGIELTEPVKVTRLVEYIPDPKTVERDRDEVFIAGFRWGLAGAVLRILQYREIAADEETLARIAHEPELETLAAWLDRTPTVRSASDLFH
jgi:hypothetical protein